MSQQINVTPVSDDYEEWQIILPDYNRNFVDEFKAHVPAAHRGWDPAQKCWTISHEWKDFGVGLAVKYFPGAEVVDHG